MWLYDGGPEVQIQSSLRYLGVLFDSSVSLEDHSKQIIKLFISFEEHGKI